MNYVNILAHLQGLAWADIEVDVGAGAGIMHSPHQSRIWHSNAEVNRGFFQNMEKSCDFVSSLPHREVQMPTLRAYI